MLKASNNKPDCTINPDIGREHTREEPEHEPTDVAADREDPAPRGFVDRKRQRDSDGLLFSCKFQIAAGASPGAKVLDNIARAFDPASNLTELGGTDGIISVQ